MASKLILSFTVFTVFQILISGSHAKTVQNSPRSFREDFDAATKPIHDAYNNVHNQINSLKEKIEQNSIFKKYHDSIFGQIEEIKQAFTRAYEKIKLCKHIFEGDSTVPDNTGSNVPIVGDKIDEIKQDIQDIQNKPLLPNFPKIPHVPENTLFPHNNNQGHRQGQQSQQSQRGQQQRQQQGQQQGQFSNPNQQNNRDNFHFGIIN